MAPNPPPSARTIARQQLAEKMLRLGQRIDRERPGPARLELLRQQATLSDEIEALRSRKR